MVSLITIKTLPTTFEIRKWERKCISYISFLWYFVMQFSADIPSHCTCSLMCPALLQSHAEITVVACHLPGAEYASFEEVQGLVGLGKESKYAQSRPPSQLLVENAKVMIDSSNAMHKIK
jgi:hypothetical protein